MTKKQIIKTILLIVVILGILGVAVAFFLTNDDKIEFVTEIVGRHDVVETVSATGQVTPAVKIDLNFKNFGQLTELNINVGDLVTKGSILARLKSTELGIDIHKARADVLEAQANLDKIVAGFSLEDILVSETALNKAEAELQSARSDLETAEKTHLQTLEDAMDDVLVDINIALTKAKISLQVFEDTFYYQGDDNNLSASDISLKNTIDLMFLQKRKVVENAWNAYNGIKISQDFESIKQTANVTQSALDVVEGLLDETLELLDGVFTSALITHSVLDTLKSNINTEQTITDSSIHTLQTSLQAMVTANLHYDRKVLQAQRTVDVSEKNVANVQANLALKKAPARGEDVALYQARLTRAEANLSYTQEKFDETLLYAPQDGEIIEVNYEIGEQTSLSVPVATLLMQNGLEIEVDIPESDIAKIEYFDTAEISLDAFTDADVFLGSIININPAQTEIQDVVYYRVKIGLTANQDKSVIALVSKIKPGMTANVTIKTNEARDVIAVSFRAVKEKEGVIFVEVLKGGNVLKIPVTKGLVGDDGLIEIISGLDVGAEVILYTVED